MVATSFPTNLTWILFWATIVALMVETGTPSFCARAEEKEAMRIEEFDDELLESVMRSSFRTADVVEVIISGEVVVDVLLIIIIVEVVVAASVDDGDLVVVVEDSIGDGD